MTAYTRTIQVSETTFQQLYQRAQASRKSADEIADQTLSNILTAPPIGDIPKRWQHDLHQLQTMSDQVLWQIAESEFPVQRTKLYDRLLHTRSQHDLTSSEQEQLDILREERDGLLLRKSYAYALLQQRGLTTPDPYAVTTYE